MIVGHEVGAIFIGSELEGPSLLLEFVIVGSIPLLEKGFYDELRSCPRFQRGETNGDIFCDQVVEGLDPVLVRKIFPDDVIGVLRVEVGHDDGHS